MLVSSGSDGWHSKNHTNSMLRKYMRQTQKREQTRWRCRVETGRKETAPSCAWCNTGVMTRNWQRLSNVRNHLAQSASLKGQRSLPLGNFYNEKCVETSGGGVRFNRIHIRWKWKQTQVVLKRILPSTCILIFQLLLSGYQILRIN